jgi:hypothetical protein
MVRFAIRTLPSVPESHRFSRAPGTEPTVIFHRWPAVPGKNASLGLIRQKLPNITAGREFHPAPKQIFLWEREGLLLIVLALVFILKIKLEPRGGT